MDLALNQCGTADHGIPFASRYDFPASSGTTLISYGDASREETNPHESGLGAWAIIADTLCYIEDRWTADEVRHYSINVLEAHTSSACTRRFIEHARAVNHTVTHSLSFTDNSTAEHVAENGKPQADGLHEVNLLRLRCMQQLGVQQAHARVASADNVLADLISRGDEGVAERFAETAGVACLRLHLTEGQRTLHGIPPTWH